MQFKNKLSVNLIKKGTKKMRQSKSFNRHIRQAREAAKGTTGINRIIAITEHFSEAGHPHADYTANQLIMDRIHCKQSDRDFAYKVMCDMAYLVATNEEFQCKKKL